MTPLYRFCLELLDVYGPQGWWPLPDRRASSGPGSGYHPGEYDFPQNEAQRFEICAGAVLAQHTAWSSAEKALCALAEVDALHPQALLDLPQEVLALRIRSAGQSQAKVRTLKNLSAFHLALRDRVPDRQELLALWGIGPETADAIRLYAYGQPEVVVDAYTGRVLGRAGLAPDRLPYEALKRHCAEGLPRDVIVLQEFHALMVVHARRMQDRPGKAVRQG